MLYAVTPAEPAVQPADLRRLNGDGVGILFDEQREMPQPRREDILAFGRSLLTLARRCPILPIRYGTVVESEDKLRELLTARAPEWRRRLESVSGHVEMLVHWESDQPDDGRSADSGHAYLMTRVAAARRDRQVADEITSALGALVKERSMLTGADTGRLACLVPEQAVQEFESTLHAHARVSGTQLWCTGPWPPFSFASEAAS